MPVVMLAVAGHVLAIVVVSVLLVEAGATWAQRARRRALRRWPDSRPTVVGGDPRVRVHP
jgi:hypothetical protein